MAYTLTYSEGVEGWVSFYSYLPDWIIGVNNHLYTFSRGNLYRHNTNNARNNFYGIQYSSTIRSVFNESPAESKLFKTIRLEGDATWTVSLNTDVENNGYVLNTWLEEKEGSYYAFIRTNESNTPAPSSAYVLRSLSGIGTSSTFTVAGTTTEIDFSISPLVEIGSMISIGDFLYYAVSPAFNTPVLAGRVTNIIVDYKNGINRIEIANNIVGAQPITGVAPYFFMYIKPIDAEKHGILGHYCVFDIVNGSSAKVELFMLGSEVMKSYP